jgi:hypothetical protein
MGRTMEDTVGHLGLATVGAKFKVQSTVSRSIDVTAMNDYHRNKHTFTRILQYC